MSKARKVGLDFWTCCQCGSVTKGSNAQQIPDCRAKLEEGAAGGVQAFGFGANFDNKHVRVCSHIRCTQCRASWR